MSSAVDRTSDFIRSVQLSRSKLNDAAKYQNDDLSNKSSANGSHTTMDYNSLGVSKIPINDSMLTDENNPLLYKSPVLNGLPETPYQSVNKTNNPLTQRSQFMKAASVIGQDLANTFTKLEQLNALARRQTLFDDHSAEIQHLTYVIKESMANLNNRIATLQEMTKSQVSLTADIKSQNARKSKYSSIDDDTLNNPNTQVAKSSHVIIPSVLLKVRIYLFYKMYYNM
ncbi:unnamed protein product [Trichobilharzia regenti]|nr:unnamed protein product [Trichobilharzia regenti]